MFTNPARTTEILGEGAGSVLTAPTTPEKLVQTALAATAVMLANPVTDLDIVSTEEAATVVAAAESVLDAEEALAWPNWVPNSLRIARELSDKRQRKAAKAWAEYGVVGRCICGDLAMLPDKLMCQPCIDEIPAVATDAVRSNGLPRWYVYPPGSP